MTKENKVGVVLFHRNIQKIYKKRWIESCLDSILNQTYKNFHIYEINYGGSSESVLSGRTVQNHKFYSLDLENYAEAMNFIITKAFDDGCDYVFNTNLDDIYHPERMEKQMVYITEEGFDLVSCDFCYIEEFLEKDKEVDRITHLLPVSKSLPFIKENFQSGNNIICHPGVCYSKKFWEKNRYDITKVPSEDFELWKKSIKEGYKFGILNGIFLYYRIHNNQMGSRRVDKKEI